VTLEGEIVRLVQVLSGAMADSPGARIRVFLLGEEHVVVDTGAAHAAKRASERRSSRRTALFPPLRRKGAHSSRVLAPRPRQRHDFNVYDATALYK